MAKTVKHIELKSYFGEKNHLEIAQQKSFTELIFETLTEREPTSNELKVFELILNLSIDHGTDTPSAVETIKAAKEGKTISESLSAGVLQINNVHGGAIEPLMNILYRFKSQDLRIKNEIERLLENKEKIPGFGHRIYKNEDPRAQLIIKQLLGLGIGLEFIEIINEMEGAIEVTLGKKLPINIDGAIAVALCGMGIEARLGKAVFLIARTPGLIAHFLNNS